MTPFQTIERAVLALGASMRLTRLVVADDVPGQWWIKDPIDRRIDAYWVRRRTQLEMMLPVTVSIGADGYAEPQEPLVFEDPWWVKYREGLDCPFCVGLWIAGGVAVSAALFGDRRWWKVAAAALTLNETAAHLGARLGDTAE